MFKKLIFLLITLYLLLIIGFYFFQEKVVFRPKKLAKGFTYSFTTKFEEVNLKAEDNSLINALHFKVEQPKGVLLYFHGNKGSLDRWGKIASDYCDYNYDVFVIDYRGYGKNTDKRIEKKMYSDALLAYNYIKQFYSEEKISVYGRSLGCTFALKVAAENTPKQLILEAPFYNLTHLSKHKFPLLPYPWLLKFKFNSNTLIEKVTCQITIFHGDDDSLIPIKSSQKLAAKITKNNLDFITLKGATHHNITKFEVYKKTMIKLLN